MTTFEASPKDAIELDINPDAAPVDALVEPDEADAELTAQRFPKPVQASLWAEGPTYADPDAGRPARGRIGPGTVWVYGQRKFKTVGKAKQKNGQEVWNNHWVLLAQKDKNGHPLSWFCACIIRDGGGNGQPVKKPNLPFI